jgi:ABC-type Zn uptake system ZnuABC Zn-binding protein ZnuA
LVEAVGDDRVEAESLAAPEQDPHAIELKPGQVARLRSAAVLVRIGLDHEPWLARVLPTSNMLVVDASKTIRLLQTETPRLRVERKAHVHAYGNTHYWLDPHNARPITASILTALATLRPAEKAIFEATRDAFLARLDARISEWEIALKPYRGTKVVVVHDSWAYFGERFGLQIVAAAEPHPGIPPSPAEHAHAGSRRARPYCRSARESCFGAADCGEGRSNVCNAVSLRTGLHRLVRGKREAARGNSEGRLKG